LYAKSVENLIFRNEVLNSLITNLIATFLIECFRYEVTVHLCSILCSMVIIQKVSLLVEQLVEIWK